jgi:hypothetical protein
LGGEVLALAIFNNYVMAGGFFSTAGGVSANNIARWDGTAWSALGSGTNGDVRALAVIPCPRGFTGPACDVCIFSATSYNGITAGYLLNATAAPSSEADCTATDGDILRLGWQVATTGGPVCCVQRGSYDDVQNTCNIGCQPPLDYIVYQSQCYSRCFDGVTDVCVSGLLAFSSGQGAC